LTDCKQNEWQTALILYELLVGEATIQRSRAKEGGQPLNTGTVNFKGKGIWMRSADQSLNIHVL
jgi:hypothetical protein